MHKGIPQQTAHPLRNQQSPANRRVAPQHPSSSAALRKAAQHTEKVVQECTGYHRHGLGRWLYIMLTVLTGGLFAIALQVAPASWRAAHFLSRCPLDKASMVLVRKHAASGTGRCKLHVFKLFLRQYAYCPEHNRFEAVPAMPTQIPMLLCDALEALHSISQGDGWEHFNMHHVHSRTNMVRLYGNQKWLFRDSQFVGGTTQHTLPAIFGIQILELVYLLYSTYYAYAAVIASLTLFAMTILGVTLTEQHAKLVNLVSQSHVVPVVQQGWVRACPSHRLVPGDVLVLQKGKAVCDMVMLRGSCLVEESMLSGETAQMRKSSYIGEEGLPYHPDAYHQCTVFAGTIVRQVWNSEDPEDEVLAMAVRVQLDSTMGSMVRQLIAPVSAMQAKVSFQTDILRLYAFSLLLQLGINLMFPEVLMGAGGTEVVCFDKTGTLTGAVAELHGIIPVSNGSFEPLQQSAIRWSNALRQAAAVCNGLTLINKTTVVGEEVEQKVFKLVEARFKDRETVVLPRKADNNSQSRLVTLDILKVLEFNTQTLKSGALIQASDADSNSALLFLRGAPGVIKSTVGNQSVPMDFDQVVDDFSSKSFRLMAVAVGTIPDVGRLDVHHMSQQQIEAQAVDLKLLGLVALTNFVRRDSKATISELQDGGGMRTIMVTGDYHHTAIAVAKNVGMLRANRDIVVIDAVQHATQAMPADASEHESSSAPLHLTRTDLPSPAVPEVHAPSSAFLSKPHGAQHGSSYGPPHGRLRFVRGLAGAEVEVGPSEAITAMVSGEVQCAVTGTAFDHLLRISDVSVLETVMRSVLVFARMKPHQKGEVMDLLSVRGLHQMHQGQPRHLQGLGNMVMFCGDGINDLAALSKADLGYAVGASDATVAASVSTSHKSVAGVVSFIKEGKAAHSLTLSLYKYMVVYQCIVTITGNLAFFVDGSSYSSIQKYAIDFQALSCPGMKEGMALLTRTQSTQWHG
ncbi:hypothetical protein WJX79_003604 [Trebouxia sp. C0005]